MNYEILFLKTLSERGWRERGGFSAENTAVGLKKPVFRNSKKIVNFKAQMPNAKLNLKEKLERDFLTALKAKDVTKISVLRMLKAALTEQEKRAGQKLNEEIILAVIRSETKKRQEAATGFDNAGRTELAKKELEEKEILAAYLPKPLSAEELNHLVDQAIQETGATDPGQIGRVIGWVMSRTKSQASGADVSRIVKQKLSLK